MNVRRGKVFFNNQLAGVIEQAPQGFTFTYHTTYLKDPPKRPISLTLPLKEGPYHSKVLFSFFDGLIPEGWLLDITTKNWKLNPRDRMGLLLAVCGDCVGAVHIEDWSRQTETEE